jgi:hypothetical protein
VKVQLHSSPKTTLDALICSQNAVGASERFARHSKKQRCATEPLITLTNKDLLSTNRILFERPSIALDGDDLTAFATIAID